MASFTKAIIEKGYQNACRQRTDINEHVPTLRSFASKCRRIREFGVRSGVSTWAMLGGACDYVKSHPEECVEVHGYDLNGPAPVYAQARNGIVGFPTITSTFTKGNVLHVPATPCELLFIDTFHVYGQLKRELQLHAPLTTKYIIMHDTTVDGVTSELTRNRWDLAKYMERTGFTEYELTQGLWKAVEEFLEENSTSWRLLHRYENNNGLTVLERIH